MFVTNWENLGAYNAFIGKVVSKFMREQDVRELPAGRYNLEDGCYVNVSEYDTKENKKFEVHRAYIDVQLLLDGEEEIWCARLGKGKEITPYNPVKDAAFFTVESGYESILLLPDQAMVLTPDDLHAPCNLDEVRRNRKLIFKIPVSAVK